MRKTKSKILLVYFTLILLHPIPVYSEDSPIISRITIRGTDIFDFQIKQNLNRFPYSWINFLHIQTKEHVIRRELLLKEGDRMDVFLIRETERNLRALSFIRSARIVPFPQRDGTVALLLHVNDSWTTEPQVNASGTEGVDELKIGFREKNLLGMGKEIDYFYNKKGSVIENEVGYSDPQLLGSHWELNAKNVESNIGSQREVEVQRPFFATDTKWASRLVHNYNQEVIDVFQNNNKISEYRRTRVTGEAGAGIKVGQSRNWVHHAGLRYKNETQRFGATSDTPATQEIPTSNDFQTFFIDWDTSESRFKEETQLEKMTRVEDINYGMALTISPGYSPQKVTGSKDTGELNGGLNKYSRPSKNNVIFTSIEYGSRDTFQSPENEKYKAILKHYYRGFPSQTIVTHARVEWGRRLDQESLIELGSENGLRAYERVAFRGSKSFLFNLEDRFYFIDELWNLFSVGSVMFFDMGYSWERGEAISASDLRSDVGIGLRLGLTRSSNEVIVRMDVAYKMQKTNGEPAELVFSFGSGQAF